MMFYNRRMYITGIPYHKTKSPQTIRKKFKKTVKQKEMIIRKTIKN